MSAPAPLGASSEHDPEAAPLRVLIVDDSATVRSVLRRTLDRAGIHVVGMAADGVEALDLAVTLRPDVITLDVEMPRMDGLATLQQLMKRSPTPVIMISSLTKDGADATIRALELGAVDFIEKPTFASMASASAALVEKIRNAAVAKITPLRPPMRRSLDHTGRLWRRRVLVIGASTGGPQAVRAVLTALPPDFGLPVAVVQHMPPGFTRSLAERLDKLGPLPCVEAEAGMRLQPGRVLLAPGGLHMVFDHDGRVALSEAAPEHGVRPAVDVTMASVAGIPRANPLGVILTGMGRDGVRGCGLIREAGGAILAEAESTSVVYGMPRAVAEAGLVDEVVPLHAMADAIVRLSSQPVPAK